MTTVREAIAETITAHDLLLKKLWCIAYAEGRAEALEEAAKVCEAEGREWDSDNQITEKNYAAFCAAAIRGLK